MYAKVEWEGNILDVDISDPPHSQIAWRGTYVGNKLAQGGEGIVYQVSIPGLRKFAMKILDKPDAGKLNLLRSRSLPKNLLKPLGFVKNVYGEIIGYTMEFAENCETLESLSNPKYFKKYRINLRHILKIFNHAARTLDDLHKRGYFVVDLNSKGIMFTKLCESIFVDTDSLRFSVGNILYCGEIADPDYLYPPLKGIDLRTVDYKNEYDIYSLMVAFFKGIFKALPYQGTHNSITLPSEREEKGVWIHDPNVTRRPIVKNAMIVTDDLLKVFKHVFVERKLLTEWPYEVIEEFLNSVVFCAKCGESYTSERKQCPTCNHVNVKYRQISLGWPNRVKLTETVFETPQGEEITQVVNVGANIYTLVKGKGICAIQRHRDQTHLELVRLSDKYQFRFNPGYLGIYDSSNNNLTLTSLEDSKISRYYSGQTQNTFGINQTKDRSTKFIYTICNNKFRVYNTTTKTTTDLFNVPQNTRIYASPLTEGVILVSGMRGKLTFRLYRSGITANVLKIINADDVVDYYRIFFDEHGIYIAMVVNQPNGLFLKYYRINIRNNTLDQASYDLKTEAKWFRYSSFDQFAYVGGMLYEPADNGIYKYDIASKNRSFIGRINANIKHTDNIEPGQPGHVICWNKHLVQIINIKNS